MMRVLLCRRFDETVRSIQGIIHYIFNKLNLDIVFIAYAIYISFKLLCLYRNISMFVFCILYNLYLYVT